MPIYQYTCPKCHIDGVSFIEVFKHLSEFDRVETCPQCQTQMNLQIPRAQATHVFKADFWDIDLKPVYIESKSQLKEECRKRDLIATAYM